MADVLRSDDSPFDKAWNRGGDTKIADDLLKQLEEIRERREGTPAHRWVWELVQNAVDCGDRDDIQVEFEHHLDPEPRLTFKHNGRAFLPEEVAALIQSWSTKLEDEPLLESEDRRSDEGKFGEGFLQSHAISERILIQGNLRGGQSFRFELDRTGRNRKEIITGLERARKEYEGDLNPNPMSWDAQFDYISLDEKAHQVIKLGLEDLRRSAALVVALSPKLLSISLVSPQGSEHWKRGDTQQVVGDTGETIVELRHVIVDGSPDFSVAVTSVEETSIILLGMRTKEGGFSLADLDMIPKLFSRYPLWGTRNSGASAIIDGCFEVIRDRSGPSLGSGGKSQHNKSILRAALERVPELLGILSQKGWNNMDRAAHVGVPRFEGTLRDDDVAFLDDALKSLIIQLSNQPLVPSHGNGILLPPSNSVIPFEAEASPGWNVACGEVWKLLRDLYPKEVVREDMARLWSSVLTGWVTLSEEDYHELGGQTVSGIVNEVRNAKDLDGLANRLEFDMNGTLAFLKRLYQELVRTGNSLSEMGILPNENGSFVQEVYTDPGVDPELISIAEDLGFSPRSRLLHKEVAQLPEFKWNEVLRSLDVEGLEGQIHKNILNAEDRRSILGPCASFLRWLIGLGDREEAIRRYPFVFLKESGEGVEQPYFVPQSRWLSGAGTYVNLFELATLADEYDEALEDKDWQVLEELGVVTSTFIIEKSQEFTLDIRKLLCAEPLPDDGKNCVIDSRPIRIVPNLSRVLQDRVRKSKDNSLDFVTLLLRHLGPSDKSWSQSTDLFCSKHEQSHKFNLSLWLARLRDHHWVWEGKDQADKPSTQNMKNLLRNYSNPEFIEALDDQDSRDLLSRLGLPPHELALTLATKSPEDELTVGNSIFTVVQPLREHPAALASLAKLAENLQPPTLEKLASLAEDPNLVSNLEEIARRRQLIRHNQSLGDKVEAIVRDLLQEGEKGGRFLEVDQVRIGADAAVRVKEVTEEGATIEIGAFLLEIKSTREERVRLTPSQVETAIGNPDAFFLCVVRLSQDEEPENLDKDDFLKRTLIISDMSNCLGPRYQEVKSVKDEASGVEVWVDKLRSLRYAVEKSVWTTGHNLEQWIDDLLT